MKAIVPKPPKPLIIKQIDSQRLSEWIEFFKNLSPRVNLLEKTTVNLEVFLKSAELDLRAKKKNA